MFIVFIILCESENRLLISPTANVALGPGFEHSKVHQIKSAFKCALLLRTVLSSVQMLFYKKDYWSGYKMPRPYLFSK